MTIVDIMAIGTFDVHVSSATERRVDPSDGRAYTQDQFRAVYEGDDEWDAAAPAPRVLRCRYVVWAAGEFQYPRESPEALPGAELCMHNSRVRSWADLVCFNHDLNCCCGFCPVPTQPHPCNQKQRSGEADFVCAWRIAHH